MKSFYFKEMLLASFREKRARRIPFHRKATVIRGGNETGKSSLIKSIFVTFGAEPSKIHKNWTEADVRSLVRFEVDGKAYSMLRHGKMFAAFDEHDRILGRFGKVTSELAPFLATLFGFGLRLPSRQGVLAPLPPAYFFLPYYMDQDGSWSAQWTGFSNLQQFANWRKALVEYHAGIRGNHYYEAQAAKLASEASLEKAERKRDGLKGVYDDLGGRFAQAHFNVDFDAYRSEVDKLLSECEKLREREERFKQNLSDLRKARDRIKTQLDITKHAREEARRDYAYATSADLDDEILCPTCGAGYANSFADRFAIAVDEDQCADLALRLTQELLDCDAQIESELAGAKEISGNILEIERLLARREGEVALSDLIRQEGRRELATVMARDLGALDAEANRLRGLISTESKRMRSLDSAERRKEVTAVYTEYMRSYLHQLDALSVKDRAIQRMDAQLSATGSELPRALLAYKVAFLQVARRFGSAAFGPLVVDSPNQQDQDDGHHKRILKFLQTERPEGSQMVLGLVDPVGIDFGGSEIVLDRKNRLLREEEFDSVGAEVTRYIDLALRQS